MISLIWICFTCICLCQRQNLQKCIHISFICHLCAWRYGKIRYHLVLLRKFKFITTRESNIKKEWNNINITEKKKNEKIAQVCFQLHHYFHEVSKSQHVIRCTVRDFLALCVWDKMESSSLYMDKQFGLLENRSLGIMAISGM